MAILVLNAGSSTLKVTLLDPGAREPLAHETIAWGADSTAAADRDGDFGRLLDSWAASGVPLADIEAVGHRVVHGGARFAAPTVVDDDVLAALDEMADIAPLHNPVALDAVRIARRAFPDVPHVACFDTAFHSTLDEAAWRYPVPRRWFDEWGLRRFGFHGLSVDWATRRAAELLRRPVAELGLVVAHLGSGSSVTAVDAGRSTWTSMGYTPLEGLMMGTRAGSVDPGVLLAVLRHGQRDLAELEDDLEHRSGLLAIARSADMRKLEAAATSDPEAALAVEMYVRRAAHAIAAAASDVHVLDAVVFTGGIGENAAHVRQRIVQRLRPLGMPEIGTRDDDGPLTAEGQRPAVLRVAAREDVVIAEAARVLLGAPRRSSVRAGRHVGRHG